MQTAFSEETFQGSTYEGSRGQQSSPGEALAEFFSEYARERPEVVALWAFGIGFVLGWRLKPW